MIYSCCFWLLTSNGETEVLLSVPRSSPALEPDQTQSRTLDRRTQMSILISNDSHQWPLWAPGWLRQQVENPDCVDGTHPCLRQLAKWLTIYFAEHESGARRWLRYAADRCDRDVPDGEVDRLLVWAEGLFGNGHTPSEGTRAQFNRAQPDLEEIYQIAKWGPDLSEYRASSPQRLHDRPQRQTATVLRDWARYCGGNDPLICFGADDCFWTRPFSAVKNMLHVHAQIVPSPMRAIRAPTQSGTLSEHSKDGTGERMFLVTEFDFSKTTPRGKPTIWGPLLERCEAQGITALDIQTALLAHLASERPLWMTVFSGGKSLQGWFPCRGEDEEKLHTWFNTSVRRLGACSSTWCVSQFVRMPDGTRAPNREGKSVRQSIVYYDPLIL